MVVTGYAGTFGRPKLPAFLLGGMTMRFSKGSGALFLLLTTGSLENYERGVELRGAFWVLLSIVILVRFQVGI